ncbi:LysR family transcriptional regulator [Piscinibacter sakaiensis]|uniref:LysR family transcriptional regulator n=1 Tax=Piscinibacter sakaiensis TaxID=1547922 RepID=UPI0037297257
MNRPDLPLARRIDLVSLQLVVAVGETGSIGRAAERAFLAASAVSKRLSDLEAALGTPLLVRHARGVALTPAGESLVHHARAMLASLEKMQGELGEFADGVRGHVRVHANISAIVQFLPEDLGAFARAHPAIKIDLEEHLSAEVLRAVQEGAADLGVCHVGRGAGLLQSLPYRRDRLVLVVPQGHPLAERPAVDFVESLDFDHVGLHTGSSIHLALHEAAQAAGRPVRLRIHVTGLDAMGRMIDNGLGIGVMPAGAFELMRGGVGARLVAVALNDPWAARELRLVARDFAALRALAEHLQPSRAAPPAPGPVPIPPGAVPLPA